MEFTTSLRKTISSIATVKGRRENNLFVVEGTKAISETLPYFELYAFIATSKWVEMNNNMAANIDVTVIPNRDFERVSFLKNPQGAMAVYKLPVRLQLSDLQLKDKLTLALDGIQDPGNLGTIIRIADWFGISTILASCDTADAFSPKVVQATMGAIGRVQVCYCDLAQTLAGRDKSLPVYGTFLDGDNIFTAELNPQSGIIVMGNEGNGISDNVARQVTNRLLIPSFPADGSSEVVESLNVGVATAITVAEFRRRL